MKIIGTRSSGETMILEASKEEIVHLLGYYWSGDNKFPHHLLEPGHEIRIHKMYNQLYKMQEQKARLADAARVLRSAAELTEMVCPILETEEVKS
jgi:RNA polymerase-interacting CarD/CdnL/TRCF family regulator